MLSRFFQNYLFKQRYIFAYALRSYEHNNKISIIKMTDANALDIIRKLEEVHNSNQPLSSTIKERVNNPAWVCFYYHDNNIIMGYSFLHIPHIIEWNDSLPTLPNEARLGSNFVHPNYRGQRIRGEICKQQINYAYKHKLKLWSVIEKTNIASIRAESRFKTTKTNNYLIKFFGRNIITILSEPLRIYVLKGNRRARR